MTNFGIYIHWPFCLRKCGYCDFYSVTKASQWDVDDYIHRFRQLYACVGRQRVSSIYIGGGTPSLMPMQTLRTFMDTLTKLFVWESGAEVTLEINPGDPVDFSAYRDVGITRISMGVQSIHDDILMKLGRRHTVAEALDTYVKAREVFSNVSLDFIYAHPWHTPNEWVQDLRHIISHLAPPHMSLYQLVFEENTPFGRALRAGTMHSPNDRTALKFYKNTVEIMRDYIHYEISAFAKEPMYISSHNALYWQYEPFAGIGPSAHGRLHLHNQVYAQSEANTLRAFHQTAIHPLTLTELSPQEIFDEICLMGLRSQWGIAEDTLQRLTRMDFSALNQSSLEQYIRKEYLTCTKNRIQLTPKGYEILDTILFNILG